MTFFWYVCPKCKKTVSTPLDRAELWCIPCGRRMKVTDDPTPPPTPQMETPLFGNTLKGIKVRT